MKQITSNPSIVFCENAHCPACSAADQCNLPKKDVNMLCNQCYGSSEPRLCRICSRGEKFSHNEEMFLDTRTLKEIDFVAQELLNIEESAKMQIGCSTNSDLCLREYNLPEVSTLTKLPVE